jgi:hypothetical protein
MKILQQPQQPIGVGGNRHEYTIPITVCPLDAAIRRSRQRSAPPADISAFAALSAATTTPMIGCAEHPAASSSLTPVLKLGEASLTKLRESVYPTLVQSILVTVDAGSIVRLCKSDLQIASY